MQVSDFDFDLPSERIALRPAEPRDSARMLVVDCGGALTDRIVSDLPRLLRAGDLIVFNDTRVLAARLFGRRDRDGSIAAVEATLHKRVAPDRWAAFMRPGKRLRIGDRVTFGREQDRVCAAAGLHATVEDKAEDGVVLLRFEIGGDELDRAIDDKGIMPLPPYIAAKRAEDDRDRSDYQTVFAREAASVAAPTAGLHFTPGLLAALEAAGIGAAFVTLHVGAGTFLPVKSETVADHRMHAEYGEVSPTAADLINATRARGGRIVCVGTTSLRLVESAADDTGSVRPFAAETAIFITPGYRFRVADGLLSNFHLPRSTLFMLVSALCGQATMRAAYAHAIAEGYRFYSYGDASLLWRQG